MDRCALFVDASYLLADGAMAVHGTRHREAVSWDYAGLLQLLSNLARERTGLSLLRCYWYEATVEGQRTPEHEALADLPGLKLRLGRVRPGRREGVDAQVFRDLTTLAKSGKVCDAVVVTGDEDMVQVVTDVQDLGMRVTIVHVAVDGNWTISPGLRQECDDLIEIGAGHLRPLVNLLSGVEARPAQPDSPPAPLSNGHAGSHAASGPVPAHQPVPTAPHAGPPARFSTPTPAPAVPLAAPVEAPERMSSAPMHSPAPPQEPRAGVHPSYPNHQLPPQTPPMPDLYPGSQMMSAPAPQRDPAPTLSDAVKAAYREGHDFGDSVARDAPALWLEAVLARKPRMPSDLEARLLQGSSLPIDFLLHDEVRHSLRRGFWDALERSRH